MNVFRFQLAINHEDPDVVRKGLDDFREQILIDHDATSSFGYCGRCMSTDAEYIAITRKPTHVSGLLKAFLNASPQLEELFVLWSLPDRESDRRLSASHMMCIAAILFCSTSEMEFCKTVVIRILHDFFKSVHNQLSSGNVPLVHATLGLLIAMCATSHQNSRDVFQKLTFSDATFCVLIQKGKMVNWHDGSNSSFGTDARTLIIILLFTILESADDAVLSKLLLSNSTMRKITHSVNKDEFSVVAMILSFVELLLRRSPTAMQHMDVLVDSVFLQKLISLYQSESTALQGIVHTFLLSVCGLASEKMVGSGGGPAKQNDAEQSAASASVSACMGHLLKQLTPHLEDRHVELQLLMLKAHPFLLSKCINLANMSWEPRSEDSFHAAVAHVCLLLSSVPISSRSKAQLSKKLRLSTESPTTQSSARLSSARLAVEDALASIIPTGFTKKEISKMLTHKSSLMQLRGLHFMQAVLGRLSKLFSESGVSRSSLPEHQVAASIARVLPDFQALVTLRTRLMRTDSESVVEDSTLTETANNDDFDFNFVQEDGGAKNSSSGAAPSSSMEMANEKIESGQLMEALLQTMERFLTLLPDAHTLVNFDLLRVLDDLVPWSSGDSCESAAASVSSLNADLLSSALRVIRQGTSSAPAHSRRWFGGPEDAVKQLSRVVVAEEWTSAVKRTPLCKLMLLCSCKLENSDLASRARSLLKSVLLQSGMFEGHGRVDYELQSELHAWIDALGAVPSHVLLLSLLVQLAFHWNAQLSTQFISATTATLPYLSDSVGMIPYSPLLHSAATLLSNEMSLICAELPKQLRAFLVPEKAKEDGAKTREECAAFQERLDRTFRPAIADLLVEVLFLAASLARDQAGYLDGVNDFVLTSGLCARGSDSLLDVAAEVQQSASLFRMATRGDTSSEEVSRQLKSMRTQTHVSSHKKLRSGSETACQLQSAECRGAVRSRNTWSYFDGATCSNFVDLSSNRLRCSPSQLCALATDAKCISAIEKDSTCAQCAWAQFLQRHWGVIVAVRLQAAGALDETALSWAGEMWRATSTETAGNGLNAMALLVLQGFRLAAVFSAAACQPPHLEDESISKKRKANRAATAPPALSSDLVKCHTLLETIAEELCGVLRTSFCTAAVFSAVQASLTHTHLQDSTCLGQFTRRVLTAAAECHFGSGSDFVEINCFWRKVAVAVSQSADLLKEDADSTFLLLARAVLSCTQSAELHKLLTSLSLSCEETVALLVLPKSLSGDCDIVHSELLNSRADDLIMGSSMTTVRELVTQHLSPLGQESSSSGSAENALHCTVYRMSEAGEVVNYCDPLTLMDVQGTTSVFPEAQQQLSTERFLISPLSQRRAVSFNSLKGLQDDSLLYTAHCLACDFAESMSSMHTAQHDSTPSKAVSVVALKHFGEFLTDRLLEKSYITPFRVVTDLLVSASALHERHLSVHRRFLAAFVQSTEEGRHAAISNSNYLSWPLRAMVHDLSSGLSHEKWLSAFVEVFKYFLKASTVSVATPSENSCGGISSAHLQRLAELLAIKRAVPVSSMSVDQCVSLRLLVNKWVKSCLKHAIHSSDVLSALSVAIRTADCGADEPRAVWTQVLPAVGDSDFYCAKTLLTMATGHSKFTEIVTNTRHPARCAMLSFLLGLVVSAHRDTQRASVGEDVAEEIGDSSCYLARTLLKTYSGSMSEEDRLLLRILQVLEFVGLCPPLCSASTLATSRKSSAWNGGVPQSASSKAQSVTGTWMFDAISPPMVYATLTRFPMWRSVDSTSLLREGSSGESLAARMSTRSTVEAEWASTQSAILTENSAVWGLLDTDWLRQCHTDVCDPAYYLPAILHTLRNYDVSIRQLANCGALSLIVACLGSLCSVTRTYALSSLHLVYQFLRKQTPDIDPAFRERAQLVLLVSSIKNSISNEKESPFERVPGVTPTMALFLARAALNVVQPSHAMYRKTNKYLLSRPFCDAKDVPLVDSLVLGGDSQTEQAERLVALRLIRDGLLTPQDHINLCRKNAYNRLLLLFPVFIQDSKVGHAVLDLLDRALSLRLSSRYLIERCDLLTWLQAAASPMTALGGAVAVVNLVTSPKPNESSLHAKYMIRFVLLLRRLINASYLQFAEDRDARPILQAKQALSCIMKDSVELYVRGGAHLSLEFYRQLVLCMWDVSVLVDEVGGEWGFSLVIPLFQAIQTCSVPTADERSRDEVAMSLLCILVVDPTARAEVDCDAKRKALEFTVGFCNKHVLSGKLGCRALRSRVLSSHSPVEVAVIGVDHFLHRNEKYGNCADHLQLASRLPGHNPIDVAWELFAASETTSHLPSAFGSQFLLVCSAAIVQKLAFETSVDILRWALVLYAGWQQQLRTKVGVCYAEFSALQKAISATSTDLVCSADVDMYLSFCLCLVCIRSVLVSRCSLLSWAPVATSKVVVDCLVSISDVLCGERHDVDFYCDPSDCGQMYKRFCRAGVNAYGMEVVTLALDHCSRVMTLSDRFSFARGEASAADVCLAGDLLEKHSRQVSTAATSLLHVFHNQSGCPELILRSGAGVNGVGTLSATSIFALQQDSVAITQTTDHKLHQPSSFVERESVAMDAEEEEGSSSEEEYGEEDLNHFEEQEDSEDSVSDRESDHDAEEYHAE